jgi:hypothetical protein
MKKKKKQSNENWNVQFLIATKNKPYMYCSACNVCYPQKNDEKKQHQKRKNKEEVRFTQFQPHSLRSQELQQTQSIQRIIDLGTNLCNLTTESTATINDNPQVSHNITPRNRLSAQKQVRHHQPRIRIKDRNSLRFARFKRQPILSRPSRNRCQIIVQCRN